MMKNEATLKFKNFNARPHSFCIRLRLARAGAALCYARPAEAVYLKRLSAVAKPSGVGKNLKSRNATSANYDADRDMRFSPDRDIIFNAYRDINSSVDRGMCHGINSNADSDINSGRDRAANFKISNVNLKVDLARPKADFR